MKLLITDAANYAKAACDAVTKAMLGAIPGVVGFATGTTTPPVYELLVNSVVNAGIAPDLSVFNVDEYIGVPSNDPRTCLARMKKYLYDRINPKKIIAFRSDTTEPEKDAARVLSEIEAAGGLSLQLLGLGNDGHIGFADPGTPWELESVVVPFSATSRAGKAAFWGGTDEVPPLGVTLGIKGIMNAKNLILLAKGESKAEIVRASLEGSVTPTVPASVLQLHPYLTVILDKAAASRLS